MEEDVLPKLSDALRLLVLEKDLLKHPFYQAWSAGSLSKEALQLYAGQYYRQVEAFPRFVSSVHSRCPDISARKVLLGNLVDEELHGTDHPALWMQFAEGLGVSADEVKASPALPKTAETVDALYALTSGEWTDGLCALFAYEAQVPEVSKSKQDGLKKFYGLQDDRTVQFFAAHQKYDVEHANALAHLIDQHAHPESAVRAVRAASHALWGFLDGVQAEVC